MNRYRSAAAASIIFQSLLVAWISEQSLLPLVMMVAAVVAILRGGLWKVAPLSALAVRGLIMIVSLIALTIDLNATDQSIDLDTLAIPAANCLLSLQVFELLRQRDGAPLPWYQSSLAIASLVAIFQSPVIPLQRGLLLTVAMTGLALILLLQRGCRVVVVESTPIRRRLPLATVVLVSLAALLAWHISDVWIVRVSLVQSWFSQRMATAAGRERSFPTLNMSASLSSVSLEKQTQPYASAVRVYGNAMPGYLRGAAYDTFERGEWRVKSLGRSRYRDTGSRPRYVPPLSDPIEGIERVDGLRMFPLREPGEGPWTKLEIHTDLQRGVRYFLPLSTEVVQGYGSRISVSRHGVLEAGFHMRHPYIAHVTSNPQPVELRDDELAAMLEVSDSLTTIARPIARGAVKNVRSTRQKVTAIEDYFQRNYRYSLAGFKAPSGTAPLEHFLREKPAAHCEFFASAAVMLLRLENVPCRYVTGYAVTELEPSGDEYWIGRNRDAHAWAEALDVDSGRWLIVEATPGVEVPKQVAFSQESDLSTGEAEQQTIEEVVTDDSWSIQMLTAAVVNHVGDAAWWTALVVCLGAGGWIVTKQFWRPRGPLLDPRRQQLRTLLSAMNQQLQRLALERASHETLHQFAARIEASQANYPVAMHAALRQAAHWYQRYASTIYSDNHSTAALEPLPRVEASRSTGS